MFTTRIVLRKQGWRHVDVIVTFVDADRGFMLLNGHERASIPGSDPRGNAMIIAALKRAAAALRTSAGLDRQVLTLSISLWLLQFIFMVSRSLSSGLPIDGGMMLARLLTALTGIALSFGLYRLLNRGPRLIPTARFLQAATLSIPACALLALFDGFVVSQLSAHGGAHPQLSLNAGEYVFTFGLFIWIFVAWAALFAILVNAEQLREQEREIAAVTQAATAAQLKALQLQFHPHFLFNTLNVISGLIGVGRAHDAERLILNLSAFLRQTLDIGPDELVSVDRELEVQRPYLEIQRARFGDRLRVSYAIDQACANAMMPPLLLLPLVENAVKHSLALAEGTVTVTIGARRHGDSLELWVADEREGRENGGAVPGFGIGLANARERLNVLFGDRATLSAEPTARGWNSRIEIPWRTAA
jgi:hypothetical protein